MTTAPSPTAEATRLMDPRRMSPAAKTPRRLDAAVAAGSVPASRPVRMNPHSSRFTVSGSHPVPPVWDARRDRLLFHDVPADTRYSWSDSTGAVVESHPTNKANGMAVDADGRILICESGANRLVRREHDGTVTVLASHFDGKELNSPNDIAVHPNGDIFFSDPAYGRIPVYGRDRPAQLGFQGVFCIRIAKRELALVASDCEQPTDYASRQTLDGSM